MTDTVEPIAIIGLAGRFPGAENAEQYWSNLCQGRESIRFATDRELLDAGVPPAALTDPTYVRALAMAPGLDMFDAGFFGFSPRGAAACDPQIRLFMETAHAALENAGYDPARVADVGVFGSVGANRHAAALRPDDRGVARHGTAPA